MCPCYYLRSSIFLSEALASQFIYSSLKKRQRSILVRAAINIQFAYESSSSSAQSSFDHSSAGQSSFTKIFFMTLSSPTTIVAPAAAPKPKTTRLVLSAFLALQLLLAFSALLLFFISNPPYLYNRLFTYSTIRFAASSSLM